MVKHTRTICRQFIASIYSAITLFHNSSEKKGIKLYWVLHQAVKVTKIYKVQPRLVLLALAFLRN